MRPTPPHPGWRSLRSAAALLGLSATVDAYPNRAQPDTASLVAGTRGNRATDHWGTVPPRYHPCSPCGAVHTTAKQTCSTAALTGRNHSTFFERKGYFCTAVEHYWFLPWSSSSTQIRPSSDAIRGRSRSYFS